MNRVQALLGYDIELLERAKMHFAASVRNNEPMDAFFNGTFKQWQEDQTAKNFEKEYIISWITYRKHEWMFAGLWKSISCKENADGRFTYETKLLNVGSEFIGRLIIQYNKPFRHSYPHALTSIKDLSIKEILREPYTMTPFPGFEQVNINFAQLQSIILQQEPSWKSALSNVKGIYLITDMSNGKLYVGSAYGESAFWNRWNEYSQNGHGGNIILKNLVKENGREYADNFRFSILETRSMNAEDDAIIMREQYWKQILASKEHGYNAN
ncbi:MAG: GIY-YIG nuclease family protein [Ignavibacteria bacterium]|jgi:hypothetical protein